MDGAGGFRVLGHWNPATSAWRDEWDAVLGVYVPDTLIITRDLFQENRKFGLQALMAADPAISVPLRRVADLCSFHQCLACSLMGRDVRCRGKERLRSVRARSDCSISGYADIGACFRGRGGSAECL